jgi:hypothetical protein
MRRAYMRMSIDFLEMMMFGTAIKRSMGKSPKNTKIDRIIVYEDTLYIELSGNDLPEYCENTFKRIGMQWGDDIEFMDVDQPIDFL